MSSKCDLSLFCVHEVCLKLQEKLLLLVKYIFPFDKTMPKKFYCPSNVLRLSSRPWERASQWLRPRQTRRRWAINPLHFTPSAFRCSHHILFYGMWEWWRFHFHSYTRGRREKSGLREGWELKMISEIILQGSETVSNVLKEVMYDNRGLPRRKSKIGSKSKKSNMHAGSVRKKTMKIGPFVEIWQKQHRC